VYIPKSMETLIEEDVEELVNPKAVDPEKYDIGEPFEGPPPPGVDSDDEHLILGLRIYSKGGQ
jgi:hypothetical protein